jgi:hypothetical protein
VGHVLKLDPRFVLHRDPFIASGNALWRTAAGFAMDQKQRHLFISGQAGRMCDGRRFMLL